MEKLFLNIVSLSLTGAVIGGILMLLHPLTRKYFSKKWNYYIWLILALRLMFPTGFGFAPLHVSYPFFGGENEIAAEKAEDGQASGRIHKSEFSDGSESAAAWEEYSKTEKGLTPEAPDGMAESESLKEPGREVFSAKQKDLGTIEKGILYALGILWLFGALTAFLIKLAHYRKLIKNTKAFCRPVIDGNTMITANVVALRLHLGKNISIYESRQVSGPVTMGLLNPFVVLPIQERTVGDVALVLHHELLHIKRKDLWYKWLWQLILCIHWFNPVFYKISKIISEDCELSCDEQILMHLSENGKKVYGNILLDTAQKNLDFGETEFLTTLLEEKKALKERLKGIVEYKKQSMLKVFCSLCAMALLMGLSACGNVIIFADREDVSGDSVYDTEDDEWSFFDLFKMDEDDFLNGVAKIDKSGESYWTYDSDEMIAGVDKNDLWAAYSYAGGDRVRCRGLGLNGSDSLYIIYAKKDTDIEISSSFDIKEGKFKIVYVAPDYSVSVLNETGDSNTVSVPLKEGRNVIKMVGKAAKLKNLEISHSTLDNDAVEKLYYSPEEEYADSVLPEIRKGNIDKEKMWDALCYMDDKTVSEILKELCKQGVTLTADELEDIFIYGSEELTGQYLAQAIKNKEIDPINGEILRSVMYYMESDTLAELIMTMDKKELTFDVLTDCVYYLDEDEADKCLMYYLDLGNTLTYSQYDRISYYLSEQTKKKIESEMKR